MVCRAGHADHGFPTREHGTARQRGSRVPLLHPTSLLCRDLPKPGLCGSPLPARTAHFQAVGDGLAADALEHLRELHECGEIEWTDVSPHAALELAFMDG